VVPLSWMDRKIKPMLAQLAERPFDSEDFVFEPKWDGTRTICFLRDGVARFQNRRLADTTHRYPELTIGRDVDAREAILDGEVVVLREGKPDFMALQTREHVGDELRVGLLAQTTPVTFMAFDLLYLDGRPLVDLQLVERKARLQEIVNESQRILISRHINTYGEQYFREVVKLGLEGVMAKRRDSTYQIGRRSRDWLKLKAVKTLDCVILGYTPGEGWRSDYFGALVLGTYREGKLEFMGKVGTGFDEALLKELTPILRIREIATRPVDAEPPYEVRWVRPELVCEVKYMELTPELKLRAPSFRRLRFDKPPEECEAPAGRSARPK
jgi:bifunctional non-homologous end joining protein LigD